MILTAAEESLTAGLEELKALLPGHYREVSLHRDHGFELDPDFPVYLERDARGELIYITLRSAGELVGYFLGFVAPALHYRTCLMLTMDLLYVTPDMRSHGGGRMLLTELERVARARGCRLMWLGNEERAKVHLSALYEKLGYAHEETFWAKWIGEEGSPWQ